MLPQDLSLASRFLQAGQLPEAVAELQRLLASGMDGAEVWLHLGAALARMNRLAEAEAAFRNVLAREPDRTDALSNLGVMLKNQGRFDEAIAALRRATEINPEMAAAHLNLGNTLKAAGRLLEAAISYQEAVRRAPGQLAGHEQLAMALWEMGRADDALNVLAHAVLIRHGLDQGRYVVDHGLPVKDRAEAAMADLRRYLAHRPDHVECLFKLASLLQLLGRDEEAVEVFQRLLALRPDHTLALSNLGAALKKLKRLDEAFAVYERAVAADPDNADALYNCANGLQTQGRLEKALALFRRAMEIRGDFQEANQNLLTTLNYMTRVPRAEVYAEHRQFERRFAPPPARPPAHGNDRQPERRLKVGYVSPDLWSHSCAYFLGPLLGHHDKAVVEVFAYSDARRQDSVTARLRGHCDHWRDIVGWQDTQVAERVRADGIDILVDLAGHTGNNRLRMFACKPAPVQVTWLGYPNTTGLGTIDYRLVDAVTDPEGDADPFHAEALVRLDRGFLCYGPVGEPPVGPPPCRTNGFVTFGSFNNVTKVTHEVAALWAEILRRVPHSRLFLKAKQFDDEATRRRFRELFASRGLAPERIEIHSWSLGQIEHLELYNRLDVALDPFPYNGTTTTCEALWMGVPVLALQGDRHAGRVSASLLTTVGVPELIALSPGAYIERAAELAADPNALADYRKGLRERMRASPLCDGAAFARKVETAYRVMWRRWCEGLPASPFRAGPA